MAEIGDIYETQAEITFEWKIKCFHSLSHEPDADYVSPRFYFSGASWDMHIYPNGQTKFQSTEWLGIYIRKLSIGSALNVNYLFCLKAAAGIDSYISKSNFFGGTDFGWGFPKFISKSDLESRKHELTPSDTLTIICNLKNNEPKAVSESLFCRHQELSDNLKGIYRKAKRTDCTLKVNDRNITAHRIILEARSSVFSAMFTHDSRENTTGEVIIKDVEKSAMNTIMEYMYSGDIKMLKSDDAFSVYIAADKYDVQPVKNMCSEFIVQNLSVDSICDVIMFSRLYKDENIDRHVRVFLKENAGAILKTEKWKTFAKENLNVSVELLSFALEALAPK